MFQLVIDSLSDGSAIWSFNGVWVIGFLGFLLLDFFLLGFFLWLGLVLSLLFDGELLFLFSLWLFDSMLSSGFGSDFILFLLILLFFVGFLLGLPVLLIFIPFLGQFVLLIISLFSLLSDKLSSFKFSLSVLLVEFSPLLFEFLGSVDQFLSVVFLNIVTQLKTSDSFINSG